jgi:UPF0755 protein
MAVRTAQRADAAGPVSSVPVETQTPPRRSERHTTEHERSGRLAVAVLLVLLLIAGAAVVAGLRYYDGCRSASGTRTPISITVPSGATGDDVVTILADKGVIACGGIVGRALMHRTGLAGSIRAGTYRITTNMTLDDVMKVITAAPVQIPTVDFTVIPGQRMTQIADTFQKAFGQSGKSFLHAAESGSFSLPPYLPKGEPSVEGFLWPQTYRFPKKGTTAGDVIQKVLDQFSSDVAGLPWSNAKTLGITDYQAVVIASMIEKEVVAAADRPLVAAVIYNRLQAGMTLGFDTTVAYIDPNPSNGLTVSDFKIDSPYNTRLNPGLPPTPIASPSIESIQAALSPAKADYLYFLQCPGEARLRFSTSYSGFLHDKACLG